MFLQSRRWPFVSLSVSEWTRIRQSDLGRRREPAARGGTTGMRVRAAAAALLLTAVAGCGAMSGNALDASFPATQVEPAAAAPGQPVAGTAAEALTALSVKGRAPKTGYDRDKFGPAWKDVDHDGCDTRNDILARGLVDETLRDGRCVVLTGTLNDPYSGKTISFVGGQTTSDDVQIDHIVALSNAWQTGAQQLSAEQREQLAKRPAQPARHRRPHQQREGRRRRRHVVAAQPGRLVRLRGSTGRRGEQVPAVGHHW